MQSKVKALQDQMEEERAKIEAAAGRQTEEMLQRQQELYTRAKICTYLTEASNTLIDFSKATTTKSYNQNINVLRQFCECDVPCTGSQITLYKIRKLSYPAEHNVRLSAAIMTIL